jgi:hypothetical protein
MDVLYLGFAKQIFSQDKNVLVYFYKTITVDTTYICFFPDVITEELYLC